MQPFVIRWRRRSWYPWTRRKVKGFQVTDKDRMILYYPDGSIEEIPYWSTYHCRLGIDWVLATKNAMQKEAGQMINLTTDLGN